MRQTRQRAGVQHVQAAARMTRIVGHVQAATGARFDRITPASQLPRVGCPVPRVHGTQGGTVPLADARRLQSRLRRGELLVVDGGHDLRTPLAPHAGHLVRFFMAHLRQGTP